MKRNNGLTNALYMSEVLTPAATRSGAEAVAELSRSTGLLDPQKIHDFPL